MKFSCASILISVLTVLCCAADPPADLLKAESALNDEIPEVAVANLRAVLGQSLPENDRAAALEKLAEALVRSNQPDEAIKISDDPLLRDSPAAKFWRGQALARLGRAAEALVSYQQAENSESPLAVAAQFGEAEMLRALHRNEEAIEKFSGLFRDPKFGIRAELRATEIYLDQSDMASAGRLLNKMRPTTPQDRKERHFLRGRLDLASQWPGKAIGTFETLLKRPRGASHPLILATLFGIADAHLRLRTPEKGDDALEDFIEHHPTDPDLNQIFAKLDQLYQAERKPSRSELERWLRDPAEPRRSFAQWYLARLELRAGHNERALELFRGLQERDGASAALAPALLEYAQVEAQDRHFDQALATLEKARALHSGAALTQRIDFLAAEIQYRAQHFEIAARSFEQLAGSVPSLASASRFNASLAWLQLGRRDEFAANYRELVEKQGGDDAELRLDAGLLQAAQGDKRAAGSLQDFAKTFPRHERVSEAWVALAELAFHASPPRLEEARKYLALASKPTPAAEERRDYLAIWIEDATSGHEAQVIELAKRFLHRHENSKAAPDVRMKLAEVYYRQQDFPNAQTEFELIAEQNPPAPWSEKALYFAAESAKSSMGAHSMEQALSLFDRVVHLNGSLKWTARNEQAAIERKLNKNSDALVLYDEVLKGDARPAEKREALCGKADIFFDMGTAEPANYQRARELYGQLAADREGATHWRKQALFKKGLCLEKESNPEAALAAFYDVLGEGNSPDASGELFWFYKAGFSAGRILEDEEKWQSAAAVYQKLAVAGGVRSEEARQRLDRVRLDHFLWEE